MQPSFLGQASPYTIAFLLLVFIFVFHGIGHAFKRQRIRKDPAFADEGLGSIEGSLLGLLALLLSFTFGVASSRYDSRVEVMTKEANSIRTAIVATDVLPDSLQRVYRAQLTQYVDARIALYDAANDVAKNQAAYQQAASISAGLRASVRQQVHSTSPEVRQSASAMNHVISDLMNTAVSRKVSREVTIPDSALWLLLILCLAASFIVGYGSKRKTDWILLSGFAIMLSVTVFSIVDLDRPHRGLNTLDVAAGHIRELKELLTKD